MLLKNCLTFITLTALSLGALSAQNRAITAITINNDDILWSRIYKHSNRVHIPLMCKSDDEFRLLSYYSNKEHNNWTKKEEHEVINLPKDIIGRLHNTRTTIDDYPIYLFYGDSTIYYCIKQHDNGKWFNGRKLSHSTSKENHIIGVTACNGLSFAHFNSKCSDGNNYIFSVQSADGGHNWDSPKVVVKHNLKSLFGWCVTTLSNNHNRNFMILSDRDNRAYITHSKDGGKNWSYPLPLSNDLSGVSYKLIIKKRKVVLIYQRLNHIEHNNDIMVWHGSLNQLIAGRCMGGNIEKMIENNKNDYIIEDLMHNEDNQYYLLCRQKAENETSIILHKIEL